MSKLIFLSNPSDVYEGNLSKVNQNVIRLEFNENMPDENLLLSGVNIINEHNGEVMLERIGYKTIYRTYKDNPLVIELSNDGSVWVRPLPVISFEVYDGGYFEDDTYLVQKVYNYEELTIPTPVPNENYKFLKWNEEIPESGEIDGNKTYVAVFEYVPTIEEVRNSKITDFYNTCNYYIVNGVDVDIEEESKHFSYTEKDQVNLKEIFDLVVQTNVPMYYHADGESCKLYTVEQIISIYTAATTNKMHHITYFNQIRMYINSLKTVEEINNVKYGQELTGEYLQTYNESMKQAQTVLEDLLTRRESVLGK